MPAPKDLIKRLLWIEKKTGKNNPNYGKYLSEETHRKISESQKGKL
jgi:hypothetical protein